MSHPNIHFDYSNRLRNCTSRPLLEGRPSGGGDIPNSALEDPTSTEGLLSQNIALGRLTYSFHFLGQAAVVPFYPVFLASRGMRPSHIGAILAAVPLCFVFTPRFIHKVLERYQIHKMTLFAVCSVGSAIAILSGSLLSDDIDPVWLGMNFTNVHGNRGDLNVNNAASALIDKDDLELRASVWSLVAASLLTLLHIILAAPCNTLLDQRMLGLLPQWTKASWGQMRVFGAYSLVWGAPACGLLITYHGFKASFVVFLLATLITLAIVSRTTVVDSEVIELQLAGTFRFLRRRRQRRLALFLLALCIMGAAFGIINTYLFLFLKKDFEAPDVVLGFTVTIASLSEMVMFSQVEYLHKKFTDQRLMQIAMLVWSLRVLGYSFIREPWIAVLMEPLHAVTFGLMWIAGTHYVSLSFPPELSVSAMGSVNTCVFGLGAAAGALIGGMMYDILGPRTFFQTTAGMMFLAVVVYFFLDRKFAAQVAFHTMADDLGDQRDEIEAPSIIGTPLTPAVHSSSSFTHQHNGAGSAVAVTQEVGFNRAPPRSLVRLIGAPGVRVLNWSKQRYAAAKRSHRRKSQQHQSKGDYGDISEDNHPQNVELPVISITHPPQTSSLNTPPSASMLTNMNRKRDLLHLDHIITNTTPHLHPSSNTPRLLAAVPQSIGSFRRGRMNLVLQNNHSPSSGTTAADLATSGGGSSFAASNASDSASKRIIIGNFHPHQHNHQPLVELLTPLGSPAVVLSLSRSKRTEKRTSKLKRSIVTSNHKQTDGRNIGKPGSSSANRNAALNFGRRQLSRTPLPIVVIPADVVVAGGGGGGSHDDSGTGANDDDDMFDSDYSDGGGGDDSWASTASTTHHDNEDDSSCTEEGGGGSDSGGGGGGVQRGDTMNTHDGEGDEQNHHRREDDGNATEATSFDS